MNLAQPAGRDGERMTVRGKAASGENSVFARAAIGKQRVGLFGQRGKDEDMRHRASLAARAPITSGLADASPPWCCRDRKSVVEGKSVSVRVDLCGRRTRKKKKDKKEY